MLRNEFFKASEPDSPQDNFVYSEVHDIEKHLATIENRDLLFADIRVVCGSLSLSNAVVFYFGTMMSAQTEQMD